MDAIFFDAIARADGASDARAACFGLSCALC
jgi:hypothetical protein